jgi:O-acetyl-ADP-ribose deacetylase (regulator of RNase III)
VYGWPGDLAAQTAFRSVCDALDRHGGIARIIFCCFGAADLHRYNALIDKI